MTDTSRLFTVRGRVQGVWFRDSTRREAERLGLTGYAINLPDGNVEVLACGDSAALAKLEAWLHQGPPLARVTKVEAREANATDATGFRIG